MPDIVTFDEELALLRIEGDEDRATSGLRRRPLSTALRARTDVIVDLAGLRVADLTLMIDLACLAQRLRAREQTLWLSCPPPHVLRMMETIGLDRLASVRIARGRVGRDTAVA